MGYLIANPMDSADCPELPLNYCEPLWYAAYTCANHEKRVAEHLTRRSVEHFLPLYDTIRKWKTRQVHLQLPLFHGYIFVRLALRDRLNVLQSPGVVKLVGFNGIPTPLPQEEIETLRSGLLNGVRASPHPFLIVGRRVKIRCGPLEGLEGILVRKKTRTRFVISLNLVMRSVAVDIEGGAVEPV